MTPSTGRLLALLVAIALLLQAGTAGWGHLYNETDGQYAGAARIMEADGSWLVPENNGIPRLVKPPLLYWFIAASFRVFGVNEFAARLPNALGVTAWVAFTFLLGAHFGSPRRGFQAGLILLTSLGTFTLGRIIMPEPIFCAFITGAIYCGLRGLEGGPECRKAQAAARRPWLLGFWIFAALASFTKGLHGLLYPLAVLLITGCLTPTLRPSLRRLLHWPGIAVFLCINLPWYFYVEWRFPGFLRDFITAEQMGHLAGNDTPATHYTNVPRWQFLLLHLAWLFPWSLLAALLALGYAIFPGAREHAPQAVADPLGQIPRFPTLLVVWTLVVFGSVLATGQRQDYYAMAAWPAFALGIAWLWDIASKRMALFIFAALALAGLLVSLSAPAWLTTDQTGTTPIVERATAWSTLAGFDAGVWRMLLGTGACVFAAATLLAAGAAAWEWRRQRLAAFLSLAAAAAAFDLGAVAGVSIVSPHFSVGSFEEFFASAVPPDALVAYDGAIDSGSSLLFYTSFPIHLVGQNPAGEFATRVHGLGADRFVSPGQLAVEWKSARTVVLVTESSRAESWRRNLPPPVKLEAGAGTQVILSNRR